jgi:ABC-2 type transport system permease protein
VSVAAARLRAFFWRDLVTDVSYRVSFALEALDVVIGVAAFFFLSRLVGGRPDGYDPFAFILVGVGLNGAMTTALVAFAHGIRTNQQAGTLKALLTLPLPPAAAMLYSSAYPFARGTLDALVYLAAGASFGLPLGQANIAGAAIVFVLALLAFGSLGLLSAAFTLVWKRGDPLLWLIGGLSWLVGGVFYPIELLPPVLQQLARALPMTHALEALRATLLAGAGLAEVHASLAVLAGFGLIGFPLALAVFLAALTQARRLGTISQY